MFAKGSGFREAVFVVSILAAVVLTLGTFAIFANAANRAYSVSMRIDQIEQYAPCPSIDRRIGCKVAEGFIIDKSDRIRVYAAGAQTGQSPLLDMRTDDMNLYWPGETHERFFEAVHKVTIETEFERQGKATADFIQRVAPTIVY